MKRGERERAAERQGATERSAAAALDALAARHRLDAPAVARIHSLLEALAREPDPPTTITEPAAAVEAHVADALTALELPPVREAARAADIGSGAGFPGLALAAALDQMQLDLLESSRRKCAVIERLAAAAGLRRARAVPERAEAWADGPGRDAYDLVIVRALGSLAVVAEYAAPLLRIGGALVAWKGRRDSQEEAGGAAACARLGLEPVAVRAVEPFPMVRHRHLHLVVKRSPTPPGFPRRPGRAVKRPLG